MRLPSDPHITQYVFLVKSLTERTDWRVYEMTADESKRLFERREMQLPDVLTLPKAEQYQKWYGLFDAVEHYSIAHGWDVDLPAK